MLLLICVFFLPRAGADVDCRTACTHCREEAEGPALVEAYCAMCRECRERRRERRAMRARAQLREEPSGREPEEPNIPPGCPTAPPCSEETEEWLKQPVQPTTMACPPVMPCESKQSKSNLGRTTLSPSGGAGAVVTIIMPVCMPCGAMCPCPSEPPGSGATLAPVDKMNMPQGSTKDFFYVYIGLPKDALNKAGE